MASNSRESWLDAAYACFNTEGLAAVRVEALARTLGATKGSFYWHFANRGELVAAIMQRWEQSETDLIIELAERAADPRTRLSIVFDLVAERMVERGGERTLYSEAEAEGVTEFVARITERRVQYVTGILAELGLPDARERATISVAGAIGMQQLYAGGWRTPDIAAVNRTILELLLR